MRDLQRLAPDVLAGVLPRLYPRMLEIAYEHQDAGPADLHLHRRLAGDGGADGDRAHLRRRGRLASPRWSTATTPAAPAGRSPTARARREAIRELAAREDIDLAASLGLLGLGVRPADAAAVGHPVAVNPDTELGRVARAEGWEVLRFERLGRRLRVAGAAAGAAALGGLGSVVPRRRRPRRGGRPSCRCGADEPARADGRAARDPRPRRALRRRADRAARRGVGPRAPFPREVFAELGELGLMGVCVPGGARRRRRRLPLLRARARGALARRRGRRRDAWPSTRARARCRCSPTAREQVERLVPPLAAGRSSPPSR